MFDEKFYESFYPLIGYVSLKNPSLAKIYKHTGVKILFYLRLKEVPQPIPEILNVFCLLDNFMNYMNHSLIEKHLMLCLQKV